MKKTLALWLFLYPVCLAHVLCLIPASRLWPVRWINKLFPNQTSRSGCNQVFPWSTKRVTQNSVFPTWTSYLLLCNKTFPKLKSLTHPSWFCGSAVGLDSAAQLFYQSHLLGSFTHLCPTGGQWPNSHACRLAGYRLKKGKSLASMSFFVQKTSSTLFLSWLLAGFLC